MSLSSRRMPPALAARLAHYREDDAARAELESKVYHYTRKTSSPRAAAPVPVIATVADVALAAVAAAATSASPRAEELTPRRAAVAGRRKPPPPPAVEPVVIEPMPVVGALPALPDELSQASAYLIERARGTRCVDPAQQAKGGAVVRAREKRLEIGPGHFRTGCYLSQNERFEIYGQSEPLEVVDKAALAREQQLDQQFDRFRWLHGDFVTGSRLPDAALDDGRLVSHDKFVDARVRNAARPRDKNAEISPRRPPLPEAPPPFELPSLALPPAHPMLLHGGRRRQEIDGVEVRACRALLSGSLSIHRRGAGGHRPVI